MKLKSINIPPLSDLKPYHRYGDISYNFAIEVYSINEPHFLRAFCCGETCYFPFTEYGRQQAIKWLYDRRIAQLDFLGVEYCAEEIKPNDQL